MATLDDGAKAEAANNLRSGMEAPDSAKTVDADENEIRKSREKLNSVRGRIKIRGTGQSRERMREVMVVLAMKLRGNISTTRLPQDLAKNRQNMMMRQMTRSVLRRPQRPPLVVPMIA